jgi:PD-(D/E)XK endonuclease
MEGLRRRHPREQGDIGEREAAIWLLRAGAYVFVPFGHSPDFDLVASFDGRLVRVEVKTSTCIVGQSRHRYDVHLATGGGNQSWNGIMKWFDPARCDFVFALVADGRRYFIPTAAIDGKARIVLGGPKYASFEVGDKEAPAMARRLLEWALGSPGGIPERSKG